MSERKVIRAGLLALAAALLVAVLNRYPALLRADGQTVAFLGPAGLGLLVAVLAATVGVRFDSPLWRAARRDGCRWGLLFGALWLVEMLIANLASGWGRWAAVPYFAAVWSVWLLTGVAGAIGLVVGTALANVGAAVGAAVPPAPAAVTPVKGG